MLPNIASQSQNIVNQQLAQIQSPRKRKRLLTSIIKMFGLQQDASEDEVVRELEEQLYNPNIYDESPQKASEIKWCLKQLNTPTLMQTQQNEELLQIEDLSDPIPNLSPANKNTNNISAIISLLKENKIGRKEVLLDFEQIKANESVFILSSDLEEQIVGGFIDELKIYLTTQKYSPKLVEPLSNFQGSYLKKEKRPETSLIRYMILDRNCNRQSFKEIMIYEVCQQISLEMVDQYELKAIQETLKEFFDSKPDIEQKSRKICFTKEDRKAAIFTSFIFKLANKRI